MNQDKSLALIFPDYYLVDVSGAIFSHEWRKKLHIEDHIMDEPPNGACTMIRTNILKEVGCYREDLGAQDGLDIWLKIKDKYKYMNINLPLFYYRRHGENLTEQPIKIINARQNIKKDIAVDELCEYRPIIAVIPCRTNYDFVKNLWSEKIAGKTLLESDIEVCMSSNLFDHIVVVCDNKDAKKIVDKYNSDERVHFMYRESKYTSLSINIVETLNQVTKVYDKNMSGIVLMRYIQSPFVSKNTIEEAISSLIISKTDCSFSVEKIQHEIFERKSHGLVSLNNTAFGVVNLKNIYRDAATCVAVKSISLKKGALRGNNSVGFTVSTAESFFIRSKIDLDIANYLNLNKDL